MIQLIILIFVEGIMICNEETIPSFPNSAAKLCLTAFGNAGTGETLSRRAGYSEQLAKEGH